MIPRSALLALASWVLPPLATAQDDAGPALDGEGAQHLEMTVEEAVALAIGNNLDLEIADVRTDVARFDELGSWGEFDWVFDARMQYSDSTREGSGFLSGGAETTTETAQLDLDLTRPLTTGGTFLASFGTLDRQSTNILFDSPRQREADWSLSYIQPLRRGAWSEYATSRQREAELNFRRQVEATRETRQRVAYEVTVAYWDLVSAIEQLGVAESAMELGRNRLDQNQRELDAGVGTEVDVIQAQAELATRAESLLQAQNDVRQREDDLKKMVFAGQDPAIWDVTLMPVTTLPETTEDPVPPWTVALSTALDMRSDLRQRRLDVDAARIRHSRAASEELAGVDLELIASSGAVDPQRTDALIKASEYRFPTYTAALVCNMPLGNRVADYAERAARAEIRSANLEYDRAELDVTAQVRQAVRNVLYAAEQVRATTSSLALARRQLDAEEARFANDLSTTFQVLEFQQSLIEAMSNERTARVGYVKSLAELENARGLIGETTRE